MADNARKLMLYRNLLIPLAVFAANAARAENVPQPCADCGKSTAATAQCDAAITSATDDKAKAALLASRAYARDASLTQDTVKASLDDLNQAVTLDPENPDARHERAYLFNELGQWREAAADLDVQVKLLPNESAGYAERAMSRFNLGDLQGAYDDRTTELRLGPTPTAYLAHARAALWLGQFDVVAKDIATARDGAKGDKVVTAAADLIGAQLTLWRTTSPQGAAACNVKAGNLDYSDPALIGDCTRVFLDAAVATDKAAALSTRSLLWVTIASDVSSFLEDSRVASALDPDNPNLHSNLGFAFLRATRVPAAIREFDAAIAIRPDYANYAGRSQAKVVAGDLDGAEADAKASMDIEPNHIALTVLGDVAYARTKDFAKAKDFWLQAYNSGPPDDGLVRRLTAAGVPIPAAPAPDTVPPPNASAP
jgi:tetratricopeptide (TPR) repeat protein